MVGPIDTNVSPVRLEDHRSPLQRAPSCRCGQGAGQRGDLRGSARVGPHSQCGRQLDGREGLVDGEPSGVETIGEQPNLSRERVKRGREP